MQKIMIVAVRHCNNVATFGHPPKTSPKQGFLDFLGFKTACLGKNLVLEVNAKMLSVNEIAGFLNFNISETIGGIKLIFCMQELIN